MTIALTDCLLQTSEERHELSDYQTGMPRWCNGCGDNAILTAMQRLCRDNDLAPERTVFVSGIGCSSRLPHYMKTYGFHGLHGRSFPIAEGVKMARPDLKVFVSTGDGDCLSIGAAHWIHGIRYNMDLTVLLHDNRVYGLTKKQASPTSPIGTKTNTTPKGSYLQPLNPLTVTLGVANVSFVAQVVDWIPELLYDVISAAYRHKGLSFVRIIQRCPEFMPGLFDPWMQDPQRTMLLRHPVFLDERNLAAINRSHGDVVVEISEKEMVRDYDSFQEVLELVRKAKMKIAIDDAGSGYSGLEAILHLKPDYIKVADSLVRNIHLDPIKREIIVSLAAIGKRIGATLVAEGIEVEPERKTLVDLGIEFGQGYLLGRPAFQVSARDARA